MFLLGGTYLHRSRRVHVSSEFTLLTPCRHGQQPGANVAHALQAQESRQRPSAVASLKHLVWQQPVVLAEFRRSAAFLNNFNHARQSWKPWPRPACTRPLFAAPHDPRVLRSAAPRIHADQIDVGICAAPLEVTRGCRLGYPRLTPGDVSHGSPQRAPAATSRAVRLVAAPPLAGHSVLAPGGDVHECPSTYFALMSLVLRVLGACGQRAAARRALDPRFGAQQHVALWSTPAASTARGALRTRPSILAGAAGVRPQSSQAGSAGSVPGFVKQLQKRVDSRARAARRVKAAVLRRALQYGAHRRRTGRPALSDALNAMIVHMDKPAADVAMPVRAAGDTQLGELTAVDVAHVLADVVRDPGLHAGRARGVRQTLFIALQSALRDEVALRLERGEVARGAALGSLSDKDASMLVQLGKLSAGILYATKHGHAPPVRELTFFYDDVSDYLRVLPRCSTPEQVASALIITAAGLRARASLSGTPQSIGMERLAKTAWWLTGKQRGLRMLSSHELVRLLEVIGLASEPAKMREIGAGGIGPEMEILRDAAYFFTVRRGHTMKELSNRDLLALLHAFARLGYRHEQLVEVASAELRRRLASDPASFSVRMLSAAAQHMAVFSLVERNFDKAIVETAVAHMREAGRQSTPLKASPPLATELTGPTAVALTQLQELAAEKVLDSGARLPDVLTIARVAVRAKHSNERWAEAALAELRAEVVRVIELLSGTQSQTHAATQIVRLLSCFVDAGYCEGAVLATIGDFLSARLAELPHVVFSNLVRCCARSSMHIETPGFVEQISRELQRRGTVSGLVPDGDLQWPRTVTAMWFSHAAAALAAGELPSIERFEFVLLDIARELARASSHGDEVSRVAVVAAHQLATSLLVAAHDQGQVASAELLEAATLTASLYAALPPAKAALPQPGSGSSVQDEVAAALSRLGLDAAVGQPVPIAVRDDVAAFSYVADIFVQSLGTIVTVDGPERFLPQNDTPKNAPWHPVASVATARRHLELSGHQVVHVGWWEWESFARSAADAQEAFLRDRLGLIE